MTGLPLGCEPEPTDLTDLARRVREIETRQRITGAHLARLLDSMERHNKALSALEKCVSLIVRTFKGTERPQVDA